VFRLTRDEAEAVLRSTIASGNRSQTATSSQTHRDPRVLPYAFTEHGAIRTCHVAASYDLMP